MQSEHFIVAILFNMCRLHSNVFNALVDYAKHKYKQNIRESIISLFTGLGGGRIPSRGDKLGDY